MVNTSESSLGDVSPELSSVFANLAEFIYGSSDIEQVYEAICVAATQMVPGCGHASVMVRDNSTYRTVAVTSHIAQQADELERATGEGACLDAIEDEPMQLESDLRNPHHWKHLAARLIAETPIRGVLGFRLLVDQRKTGALNLFSEAAGVFDTAAVEHGTVLASFATVAAGTADANEEAALLLEGSRSSQEIGKAVGILMTLQHGMSEQQAYGRLRHIAHDMGTHLGDAAAMVNERRAR